MIERTRRLAKHPLSKQVFRFGCVGTAAAITNLAIVAILVPITHMHPLMANVFAFIIAFQVSFYGHKAWTFQSDANHLSTMSKFFIVASISFALNEGLYALILKLFHFHYMLSLFIVLIIVPPVTFIFSKFWAFAK